MAQEKTPQHGNKGQQGGEAAPPQQWPTPAAMGQRFADIAVKSQEALNAFLKRQADDAHPQVFDFNAIGKAFSELSVAMLSDPVKMAEAQIKLWQNYTALFTTMTAKAFGAETKPLAVPQRGDRRFKHEKWETDIVFDYLKQSYLIGSEWLQELIAGQTDLPDPVRTKLQFYIRQYVDAMSPTNFAATNPEVLQKTLATGGDNLLKGFTHFLEDVTANTGLVKRRAPDTLKVGVNLAVTKGSVIYRTDLMELIQYDPATPQVHKTPVLLVPPWVNKFYLFDLQEKNSFVKWLVEQGFTVFAISWVNPDASHAGKDFEDYLFEGPQAAMAAIQRATGEDRVNLVGYCLGGTLTAVGLAYLAAKGEADRVSSATLIATLIDYERLGEFEVFLDKEQLDTLDKALKSRGYLESQDLGRLFSALRANDLIWSVVVNNYLLAEESMPFDMLTWFADGARMPAKMISTFVRRVAFENALAKAGALSIGGVPLDLAAVKTPTCFVSLKDDHVALWENTYTGTQRFSGPRRFMLGGSGHNAGTINPPSQGKFGYWTNPDLPPAAEQWLAGATKHEGSWWPEWAEWLKSLSGEMVAARQVGAGALAALEPAPGSYVRVAA